MILTIPILNRLLGLEEYGMVMAANAFASIMGGIVNYGTIQSSVKLVTLTKDKPKELSKVLSETLSIRFAMFIPLLLIIIFLKFFLGDLYYYYLLSTPLIFAELVNPLFFFLGIENLTSLNLVNLFTKIISLLLIVFFIGGAHEGIWVNFILGTTLTIGYCIMLCWAIYRYQIKIVRPKLKGQLLLLKNNFYLLVNNFAVQLQQSIMLFAIQTWGNPTLLGAYAICDKIVWSCKLLIISISNSIYPKSAQIFHKDRFEWEIFKKEVKFYSGLFFFMVSLVLFLFAPYIIAILTNEINETAINLLRIMAWVPAVISLNFINVLDRILTDDTRSIFQIALMLLCISGISAYLLLRFGNTQITIGYYTLIIETCAFLLYEIYIRYKFSAGAVNANRG